MKLSKFIRAAARSQALAGAMLVGFVLLLYLPGFGGGFAFDDYSNLVYNKQAHVERLDLKDWARVAGSSPSADLPRPLAMLSFGVNIYLTGLDPRPMKATNIAIHGLNALLAFWLAVRLVLACKPGMSKVNATAAGLAAATWWASMPINVTAVLLIVQRMESLSHTFVFSGLLLYMYARRQVGSRMVLPLAGAGFVGLLGVLVKESAALLPIYCLALEGLLFHFRAKDGQDLPALKVAYTLVFVAAASVVIGWLLPRATAPGAFAHRSFSLTQRLLTEPRIIVDYIRWCLAPNLGSLGLYHDGYRTSTSLLRPISTLASIIGLATLATIAFAGARRYPLASLGMVWFLSSHLLTGTFLPLELAFEHRNYFGSFGLCLVLLELVLAARRRAGEAAGVALAACLFVLYAGSTLVRTAEWSEPLRFTRMEAARHPESPRATYQLAQSYAILSRFDPNSPWFRRAVRAFEFARKVPDAGILPAQGQLVLQSRAGVSVDPALWQELESGLRERPIGAQDLISLGTLTTCVVNQWCELDSGRMSSLYGIALARSNNPELLNIYANFVLNINGDRDLAQALWGEAHRIAPREPQYVIALAKLATASGDIKSAKGWINTLESMGHFGEYDGLAQDLRAHANQAPSGN